MKFKIKSFTLIELIVVIAIIIVLSVSVSLILSKQILRARNSSRISSLKQMEYAFQIKLTSNNRC